MGKVGRVLIPPESITVTETDHSRYTGLAILRFIFEAIASFGI